MTIKFPQYTVNNNFLTQSWNTKSLRTLWCAKCLIFVYASLETPQALELYGVCSGYWWGFTLTLSLFLGGQPLLDDIYCCIKSAQSTFSLQKKKLEAKLYFSVTYIPPLLSTCPQTLDKPEQLKNIWKKYFIRNII